MHNNIPHEELVKKLQPPQDAKTSIMLNNIGNGTMLGAMPFIIAESYYRITQKIMPPAVAWANLALTAVGAAWGYVSGKKEYARLQEYRQTVSNQVIKISEEVEGLKTKDTAHPSSVAHEKNTAEAAPEKTVLTQEVAHQGAVAKSDEAALAPAVS